MKALYLGTLFNSLVLAMVLLAAREIFEPLLLWHLWLPGDVFELAESIVRFVGVPFASAREGPAVMDVWIRSTDNLNSLFLLVSLTAARSVLGGLRAVVRTDLMQLGLMLAALASTIDSHLDWGASYRTNDLYDRVYCRAWRRRVPSDRALVWVARLSKAAILLLALAILPNLSSIQRAWHTSLLLGAGVGVILVLRSIWWPVAAACGSEGRADRGRLAIGLAATGLAAWSVFASLTALGSLLIGSPAPSWMPHRGTWLTLLLVTAIAAAPIWMRLGARARVGAEA